MLIYIIVILIYIAAVAGIFRSLNLLHLHINKLLKYLVYSIDEISYYFIKTVYSNKSEIYNYKNALEVLFNNKKKFLTASHSDYSSYYIYYTGITEDISYLSGLLQKDLELDRKFVDNLKEIFQISSKMRVIYKYLRIIAITVTLGVGYFFIKKDFS